MIMELEEYIACICEGLAEEAIIDLLLENNKLEFNKEQLLEEKVIRCEVLKILRLSICEKFLVRK